ncbi:MAG TPA: ABC transporter permease [Pyrinomonadaceae bacterium]|jgi:ABC-type transport system involved in multi-copper enzyme maturation permease subunit|nr:ABC transporter permease [Pyrinomonadaceae bacterium]
MKHSFYTSFAAVFTNEVLLSTKRVAPYVLIVLFAANKVLWWAKGPAVGLGWATNSDFNITRDYTGFCFLLGLPIFTGIIMGDPIVRDFRLGVDPLIFSKPLGRAAYVLGKFFGNFFVLVCCQSAFAITAFLLQWVPFSGMVVLPVRAVPFVKHFLLIVVISHLMLAAVYFAAGTLTRNAKVVYLLAAAFYPVYIAFELFVMKPLPVVFRILLDPLGFNTHREQAINPWQQSAEFLNQYVVTYDVSSYVNRISMVLIAGVLLLIVCRRFSIAPLNEAGHFTGLKLSSATERIAYAAPSVEFLDLPFEASLERDRITLPKVTSTRGRPAPFSKILAALGTEFRLLRAERSLLVLISLVILLSIVNLPPHSMVPEVSYSVVFATNTANTVLVLVIGLIVFYTGETIHRERELKVQPLVWSTPVSNSVLLLSKYFAMVSLILVLVAVVSLIAIVAQLLRGHALDFSAYMAVHGIVLVPGILFITALVVALNVLLRNKYAAYVVAVGVGAGLVYLYNTGHTNWLYNPLLYRIWTYPDLTTRPMLINRLYCLGLCVACLAVAHLFFPRKTR